MNSLHHTKLPALLQRAYSAERAASYAYQGHAGSVKDKIQKKAIKEIEEDEWHHRACVLAIMKEYNIPVSKWLEIKFWCIGKTISASCYVIGWFMPYFFAGKLESGNVCEYFRMMQYFYEAGITKHNYVLYEMGLREKEHELYFLAELKDKKWLPYFEKLFGWGISQSANNVNMQEKYPVEEARKYCSTKV